MMKLIPIYNIYDSDGTYLTYTVSLSQAVMWCDMHGADDTIYKVEASDGAYLVHVGEQVWTEKVA